MKPGPKLAEAAVAIAAAVAVHVAEAAAEIEAATAETTIKAMLASLANLAGNKTLHTLRLQPGHRLQGCVVYLRAVPA